jgi:inosose dehydratase
VCVDTGHFAYAGVDPAAFLARDPASVGAIHLKDLHTERISDGFWRSVAAGAFVPLGRGSVDFEAVLATAARVGYEGWMVVEQDRVAGTGDPVRDLEASRRFLDGLRCG